MSLLFFYFISALLRAVATCSRSRSSSSRLANGISVRAYDEQPEFDCCCNWNSTEQSNEYASQIRFALCARANKPRTSSETTLVCLFVFHRGQLPLLGICCKPSIKTNGELIITSTLNWQPHLTWRLPAGGSFSVRFVRE